MTQDVLWLKKYNEVIWFIETNKWNPSKHDPEERGLYLNWLKHNRKMMNSRKMKEDQVALFLKLLELSEKYMHKNQYK